MIRRFLVSALLLCASVCWGQDFVRTTIGTTQFTSPLFQQRYNAAQFSPPILFDIGAASQTIFSVVPLTTTNTIGFAVTAPAQASVVTFPAPGSAAVSVAYMPAAGGQITTNGTAVGAGVCQAQPALTITGVTTTSAVSWSVPTALPATWQTGIFIMPVVTANTVTLSLCNGTAGSITPAAQLVNIRAFQ